MSSVWNQNFFSCREGSSQGATLKISSYKYSCTEEMSVLKNTNLIICRWPFYTKKSTFLTIVTFYDKTKREIVKLPQAIWWRTSSLCMQIVRVPGTSINTCEGTGVLAGALVQGLRYCKTCLRFVWPLLQKIHATRPAVTGDLPTCIQESLPLARVFSQHERKRCIFKVAAVHWWCM